MKRLKLISTKTTSLFMLFLMVISLSTNAQINKENTMKKDCCMMKNGQMMVMKDGEIMPMDKNMVMKNGTVCTVTGECILEDGTKMQMEEGDWMKMNGKICSDNMRKCKKCKA